MSSVQAEERQQVVDAAVREISHIATLPEVTVRIIELVEDPSSTASDLHMVISNDPALCSRILKVVNSSFYGLPGQIGSINRAIVLLGLNAVKNIAISASMAKLFRSGEFSANFSAKALWQHSVMTAAASKLIADKAKLSATDEAFLSGLIHDLGVMVEMQADRPKLTEVVDRIKPNDEGVPSGNMLEVETEIYGANHQDFGEGLCQKWKFPKVLATVAAAHHSPLELPENARVMPCVVYLADRLAAQTEDGYRLDLPSLDIDPGVLEVLKLSEADMGPLTEQLAEASADVMLMLT